MGEYYDMNGKEISQDEAYELMRDIKNRRVAETHLTLKNGKKIWVSTVLLVHNWQFGDGKPIIFETMVFKENDVGTIKYTDLDCDRYSTLEEAKKGHYKMVEEWRTK